MLLHGTLCAGHFTSAEALRRQFWIADGGFTELHALWQLEEKQIEKGKEYETWFRLHDFWLLAGVITYPWSQSVVGHYNKHHSSSSCYGAVPLLTTLATMRHQSTCPLKL